MPVRRGPLRCRGRVSVRAQLPLFELSSCDGWAFKPFAGIEREKLHVTKGEDNLVIFGDSKTHNARCKTCGSFLYSKIGDGAHVTMGTLVDEPTLGPTAHIFVGSKAPWFTITDDLPQHEEFP
jgi:hypothetical protein